MENSRINLIKSIVKDKNVLDVGCVDHSAHKEKEDIWLHKIILKNAKKVTGLDFEKNEVEKLNENGYNVIYGNAETINIGNKFEVIVAGELIEHLDNPGMFLRNMKQHLEENGKIILTTPNPFYLKRIFEILLYKSVLVHPQHVSWYCPKTLNSLFERVGYKNIKITPFNNSERYSYLVNYITKFRPWFSTNLIIEATI